jgi:hypothetical protein
MIFSMAGHTGTISVLGPYGWPDQPVPYAIWSLKTEVLCSFQGRLSGMRDQEIPNLILVCRRRGENRWGTDASVGSLSAH